MNYRKAIRTLCGVHDKKQKDLAEHLGITHIYLSSMIKNNDLVHDERKQKVADFFGISLKEFENAG